MLNCWWGHLFQLRDYSWPVRQANPPLPLFLDLTPKEQDAIDNKEKATQLQGTLLLQAVEDSESAGEILRSLELISGPALR